MSQNSCCSFCEQLPTIARPGRGSASKCPLCKQDLWVAPDGVTLRLVDERDPAAPRQSPRFLLAGLGVGLLALVCAGVALTRMTWGTQESTPVQAPAVAQVLLPPIAAAPAVVKPPELPPVQFKRAIPDNAARVKPHKSTEADAKAAVKPIPHTIAGEGPRVRGIHAPIPAAWKWGSPPPSEELLSAILAEIPQLDLDPEYGGKDKKQLAEFAKDVLKQNAGAHDGFITKLAKDRTDLAGLPFLRGKDCVLPAEQAKRLAVASLETRRALAEADGVRARSQSKSSAQSESQSLADLETRVYFFWEFTKLKAEMTPAVHQILSAQSNLHRYLLAKHLTDVKGPQATQTLVKLALYDLNADVRSQALKELAQRPKEEYLDDVVKAFRHPWEPVNQHASQAAVFLQLKELIPELVAMFSEPEPTAPFTVKTDDGKQKTMIRELVRINHHRNCLLCHAPIGDLRVTRDMAVGPVTSMDDELPP
jgi:hypothetical protein